MVEHEHTGPLDLLTWSYSRIAMWGPAFIVAIILFEVIMRYFFAAATLWVNELSLWVGGAIYLSAGLYAMQQRSHIRIFIIYDVVPLWLKRVFDVISTICVGIFAFAVIWGGYGEATTKFLRWERFGTAFDPPIPATIKPLILMMMFFLALQATSNLVRDWPSKAIVRKVFDISVTFIVVGLALWTIYQLFVVPPPDMAVPQVWLIAIFIGLLISVGLMLYGLVHDFNRTPNPHVEIDEIEDEVAILKEANLTDDGLQQTSIPVQILSGNPPKPSHGSK